MSDRPRDTTADAAAPPPLTVVIVNWNGRGVLPDCLRSLRDTGYPDLKVVLADNASHDDSVAWTRRHYPEVRVLETGGNLRWAGGNNAALRMLQTEGYAGYTLLLNNDTVVPQASLGRLVESLAGEPAAWAATPRICYADDPSRAWYDGGAIGRLTGWIRHQGIRRITGDLPLTQRFVGYGTGCALLLAPGVVDRIGLFDEGFHFYGEDADYSLRIAAAGGRILHVPRSLILHKVSASVGAFSPRKIWLRNRSHVRLLRKHWPRRMWPLLLVTQTVYLTAHAAFHLWGGRPATALAVWQGALDELRGRPY